MYLHRPAGIRARGDLPRAWVLRPGGHRQNQRKMTSQGYWPLSTSSIIPLQPSISSCNASDNTMAHLPCQLYPADTRHRYHVVSKVPFRLSCPVCRHNLNSGKIMKWMASLVVSGRVSRAAAGLDTDQDGMDIESGAVHAGQSSLFVLLAISIVRRRLLVRNSVSK